MAYVTMRQMLEAGVHFGHQTRRWNPKMKPYIFGERNGIYIIDLQKTVGLFRRAHDFVVEEAARGGSVLFVGTKRQAQDAVREEAERCGMFSVHYRWLGGMLTNFQTIKRGIERLKALEAMHEDGSINRFPKKEIITMGREREKLLRTLGGIKNMRGLPSVVFVIDPHRERIAVTEANRLGIPVVAIADTNCDPDGIDYVIPGNDDAIRAIRLLSARIADAALEGRARHEESLQAVSDKETPAELIEAAVTEEAVAPATQPASAS
ncbi:MAG: 30S ribosomal protein S2 [Thermodesulfobacteriota bacterium]